MVERLLENAAYDAPTFRMDEAIENFYDFTVDSFSLADYRFSPFDQKIPVAV